MMLAAFPSCFSGQLYWRACVAVCFWLALCCRRFV